MDGNYEFLGEIMKLMVTLEGSHNEYIKYPAFGELEILEVGTHSHIIKSVFRERRQDGSLAAPVRVKQPKFSY